MLSRQAAATVTGGVASCVSCPHQPLCTMMSCQSHLGALGLLPVAGRYSRYKHQVGSGRFKVVYKGFDERQGIDVAWSKIEADPNNLSPAQMKKIVDDISNGLGLDHPHIIKVSCPPCPCRSRGSICSGPRRPAETCLCRSHAQQQRHAISAGAHVCVAGRQWAAGASSKEQPVRCLPVCSPACPVPWLSRRVPRLLCVAGGWPACSASSVGRMLNTTAST